MDFLRRIEPFQRVTLTPRHFFLFKPIPTSNARGGVGVRPALFVGPSVFISGLFEASEGLAPFDRGCLGAVSTRPCRPRSLIAKKGILASPVPRVISPGTADLRKKTGRSIRRPAEIRPRERGPNRFRAWISGRAPALHAFQEYLTNACLRILSLRFADREADAAAFRRARSWALFIQR